MHNKTLSAFLLFVLFLILLTVEPALAGPGGKIATAVFDSFWGKVLLIILVIVFLPLILLTLAKEKVAERKALRDLRFMAKRSPHFDWLKVRQRVQDCFFRVHSAWQKEDMTESSNWMTDWYWKNQQMVYLDRWEREGLYNHCDVKEITSIKPLLFAHHNEGGEHEDSMLAVMIGANMQDFLAERDTGNVVEGSRKYKDVEKIWSFTLVDGAWKVSNIEDSSFSLTYAALEKTQPAIEETLLGQSRASIY